MKKILFLLLLASGWLACTDPDLPPDLTEDPVFTVQFTDGDSTRTIAAGIGEYYLFTRFAPDNHGVMVCSGAFAPADCPTGDCTGSLTFEFRNTNLDNVVFPDTLFKTGNYAYSNQGATAATIYRTTFVATNPAGYNQFSWKINNNPIGTNDSSITVDFLDNGPQKVELTASGAQVSTIQRTITLSQGIPLDSMLTVDIQIKPDTTGIGYNVDAIVSGAQAPNIQWSTGNVGPHIYVPDTLQPDYSVTVTNALETAVAGLVNIESAPVTYRTSNFTYDVQEINTTDTLNLGAVAIQWVDQQGIVWRSDRKVQDPGAQFSVLESAGYDLNENAEKTRRMRVAFQCILYNDSGVGKAFSGEGVIAVAYP